MKKHPKVFPYGISAPFEIPKSADKLLNEYWDIAKSLNIETFLVYGTCLGFIRDGGYIERDNDIDVGILGGIGKLRVKLTENKFVKKKKWPPTNYHFLKYNILLDIFTRFPKSHLKYFQSFDKIIYKDRIYNVPHPVEEYLETLYGDWKTRKLRPCYYPEFYKNQEQFWKTRSEKFNNLNGLKDTLYIEAFVRSGEFKESDLVLDVGTGTGIIAHAISPVVKKVIGIDTSQDMLDQCKGGDGNQYIKRDIRNPKFPDNVFDKVTARSAFHHIVDDTQEAMDECYRVLKRGGKMILSEAIPPTLETEKEYTGIFNLKEERLTFTEEKLVILMAKSGFKNIRASQHITKNFSVNNWLENSGLVKERQDKIFELHVNASDTFKKAYNMRITKDDCFIDIKNLILVGEKEA